MTQNSKKAISECCTEEQFIAPQKKSLLKYNIRHHQQLVLMAVLASCMDPSDAEFAAAPLTFNINSCTVITDVEAA